MTVLAKNDFGQVQQLNLTGEFDLLTIEHQNCQAKVSLYGGQVLSWKPSGQKDVFWLSETATFKSGKAIRGGIPICWPWFGAHPEDINNVAGNHGFAREQFWQVSDITISEIGIEISLVFQGDNMHAIWPNACKLKQVLFFGKTYTQSLTMSNLGKDDVFYTGALHSYFHVSAPENISIDELSDAPFDDKLTGQSNSPTSLVNGVGPIDRVYHSNRLMNISDSQWQRTIEVKASNTEQWVFWNPGDKIAATMADIHSGGEQEFVCLEAANTNMQLLSSGKSLTMSQVVSVTPIIKSK